MPRLTKDERDAIRRHAYDIGSAHAHAATDFGRKVLDAPENIVSQGAMRLLDELAAAEANATNLTIDADTAQGEYRRLRDTFGEVVESHDNLVKEVARLRKALHLICEIHSARFEHPTFTLLGVLDDIRKAASTALGSDVPTADVK